MAVGHRAAACACTSLRAWLSRGTPLPDMIILAPLSWRALGRGASRANRDDRGRLVEAAADACKLNLLAGKSEQGRAEEPRGS